MDDSSNTAGSGTNSGMAASKRNCSLFSRHNASSCLRDRRTAQPPIIPLSTTLYGCRSLCSPCGSSCRCSSSSRSALSTAPHRSCIWRGYKSLPTTTRSDWPLGPPSASTTGRAASESTECRQYRPQPPHLSHYQQQQQQQQRQQKYQEQQQPRRRRRRQMKRSQAGMCEKRIHAYPTHGAAANLNQGELLKANNQGFTKDSNSRVGVGVGVVADSGGVSSSNSTHRTGGGTVVCQPQL